MKGELWYNIKSEYYNSTKGELYPMAKPSEKLSQSLEVLHKIQLGGGAAIQSNEISRTHRERLCQNGFLKEIIKGWYIPTRPDEAAGESTAWYAAFWPFCASYLNHLKGDDWCLSPEQSLLLHAENWSVPRQLLVRAPKARNHVTKLPFDTSLFVMRAQMPAAKDIQIKEGVHVFLLPMALIYCSPKIFRQHPADMRVALAMIRDSSEVLHLLLEGGHSTISGSLAGAFRNIGRNQIADDIINTMRKAGYDVRENDPFNEAPLVIIDPREHSPYVNRLRLMWESMRVPIIKSFPKAPGLSKSKTKYLKNIEANYISDAYHSLSIEGYHVNRELIERVRSGQWNPDNAEADREHTNALAARGYWQAYQAVYASVEKVLNDGASGKIVEADHRHWYRELFAPCVTAGLVRPSDLAGYRNAAVYIRKSMYIPPSAEAVRELMPTFFELLSKEPEASVRAVLGHFIFVYIHPYTDGNGRMGRFLMNVMLASGGYPWTIIPVEKRKTYMSALEQASVKGDIVPFSNFISSLV